MHAWATTASRKITEKNEVEWIRVILLVSEISLIKILSALDYM